MNRRTVLFTTSSIFLSQALMGCSPFQSKSSLRLQLLQASLPPQVTRSFQKTHAKDLTLSLSPTPDDLFKQLQRWGTASVSDGLLQSLPWNKPSEPSHLLSLGDAWLSAAIAQNLLRPLTITTLKNWPMLPHLWQQVGQRDRNGNYSQQGQVWGIPYRWGITAIAYHREKFKALGWQPTDWSDLWRPELQGRISLLDQPREVIGMTLRRLGSSYNVQSLKVIPQLMEQLRSLHQQASFYSSVNYLQPLIAGDTWVAQGWSSDIILAMQQHPEIEIVVPRSGTALWADLWVQPRLANPSEAIAPWLDFCLDEVILKQIARFSRGGTWTQPVPLNPLQGESAIWLDAGALSHSEFLQPLSEPLAQEYQDIWQNLRQSVKA